MARRKKRKAASLKIGSADPGGIIGRMCLQRELRDRYLHPELYAILDKPQAARAVEKAEELEAAQSAGEKPQEHKILDPDSFLTALEIYQKPEFELQKSGISLDAFKKQLVRWQKDNFDGGWKEITDRKPQEGKYIYRVRNIFPLIEKLKAKKSPQ